MDEIKTSKAPEPVGIYSQAVKTGSYIFLSGQIPLNPKSNELINGDIKEQTLQIFNNIKEILKVKNLTFKNIVKVEVYLTNIDDFKELNKVYEKQFTKPYPARHVVEVSKLPLNAKIETACTASIN